VYEFLFLGDLLQAHRAGMASCVEILQQIVMARMMEMIQPREEGC